jgi:hypothetical protein
VARRGAREIRDFTADPRQRKAAFEQARDLLVERGDGKHGGAGVAGVWIVREQHGVMSCVWL